MEILQQATSDISSKIVFRPHPTGEFVSKSPFSWASSDSLKSVIENADLIVCGPASTVALDALMGNRAVIVLAHAGSFIASPAEGQAWMRYARTPSECQEVIAELREKSKIGTLSPVHVFADNLVLWSTFISRQLDLEND